MTAVAVRTRRGEARRRAILEAALAIVGREGTGGVTHRAVAAEAGVPLAATTYYFASRDELLAETLVHAAAEDLALLERDAGALLAPPLNAERLAARLAGLVSDWLDADRPTLIAQVEICLEAARRPELATVARGWTDAYVRALAAPLAALGARDPERDAWLLFAALYGMYLDQLVAPQDDFERGVMLPALERLLGALVRGHAGAENRAPRSGPGSRS